MAQFAEFAKKYGIGFVEYLALRYAAEGVVKAHPESYGEDLEDGIQSFFIMEIFPDFKQAEKQGKKIDLIDYLTEFFI